VGELVEHVEHPVDARGLEVSPGGLLQNELVQRQIRDRLAQPAGRV
jgi:hypothetical protein